MAEDFRTLLKEDSRDEATGERWFADMEIGSIYFLSIQASALHGCEPAALLDDLGGYTGFQVTIQLKPGAHTHGRRGALQYLAEKPWWPMFIEDSIILRTADNVPPATVQQIFEDMLACVEAHPELAPKRCGGGCLASC